MPDATPQPDETLDTLGLHCPIPVWETAKRIRDMQPGQVLEVLSDDPTIEQDMPTWCKRTGHPLLAMRKDGTVYHALVRKQ
ncbi:MAG: sulfurtransferase TusA family protein [Chloroflexi bacterium]|nr:sulfurtransferase TusA family protein [Chloroflexota bacterium]